MNLRRNFAELVTDYRLQLTRTLPGLERDTFFFMPLFMIRYTRGFLALLLSGLASLGAAQGNLQVAAETALTGGMPERALVLATQLLEAEPENFAALYIAALAQTDLNLPDAAARSAARAYRAATTPADRLQAARLAGSTQFRLGNYTRAEWWLRRAANNTATTQQAADVRQEFSLIRQRNPLRIRIGGGIAPSDNINYGSEDETFRLEGLPFDFFLPDERKALAGTEFSADARVTYKLSENARQLTEFSLYSYGRTYRLTDQAKKDAPEIEGSDFSLTLVEVSVSHSRRLFNLSGPTRSTFHVGETRYGGNDLWDYWRITLGQDLRAGQNGVVSGLISYQDQTARREDQFDTIVSDIVLAYGYRLSNGDQASISIVARKNDTGDIESTFEDYQAIIDYDFAQPVLGTNWSGAIGIGHTNYDEFSLSLDGRRDDYIILGAKIEFAQISYFGFSPNLNITAQRTESDVSQFSTSQVQARFGIQSNF